MNTKTQNIFVEIATLAYQHRPATIGLIGGKMGLAINLFHLAKYTDNQEIELLAERILEEVYAEIRTDIPSFFGSGLSGICWGIEYLVQNQFIEIDGFGALKEMDTRLKRASSKNRLSFLNGLSGIAVYFLKRIQNDYSAKNSISVLSIKRRLVHQIMNICTTFSYHETIWNEPETVNKYWNLAQLFDFLAQAYTADIFNSKIIKALEASKEKLKQLIVKDDFHKLLLAKSLWSIYEVYSDSFFKDYVYLLVKSLNINALNVNYENLIVVSEFFNTLQKYDEQFTTTAQHLKTQLKSRFIELSQNELSYQTIFRLGFFDGYAGFYKSLIL